MRSRALAGLARWALFVACVALPAWLWPHGAVLGYLAQTAALVVLALSLIMPAAVGADQTIQLRRQRETAAGTAEG